MYFPEIEVIEKDQGNFLYAKILSFFGFSWYFCAIVEWCGLQYFYLLVFNIKQNTGGRR